jgi:type II secretory pathway pseudopilin PulG
MVVIAVLGLLLAILLPSFRRAREQGRRAACASNLRQIGVGFSTYMEYNGHRLPFASFMPSVGPSPLDEDEDPIYIADVLLPVLKNDKNVFRCPGDLRGRFQRDPPNDGKSYFESERSSYEYRTGWLNKDFTVMGKSVLEAVELLERVYRTKVPDNTFWIMRDYRNFHSKPAVQRGVDDETGQTGKGEAGARRYLYSDGHVGDYENV